MLDIVGTPIGNLDDITLRAIETLKNAEIILTEDTRRTKILLDHYDIKPKQLVSFYEQTSPAKLDWIICKLQLDITKARRKNHPISRLLKQSLFSSRPKESA